MSGAGTFCHIARHADPISVKTAIQGEMEWGFGRARYAIQPDMLLFVPDGDEYAFTIDSPRQPCRGFNVHFRQGLVEGCFRSLVSSHEDLLDTPFDIPPLSFPRRLESRSGAFGAALNALIAAVAAGASEDHIGWLCETLGLRAAESALEQRRERLRIKAVKAATRLEIHRRLYLARDAVEADLSASWTLQSLAVEAMMAPHHFHRSFHAVFGETPRNWLSRRRAERAMALLRTSSLSVTEICLTVGYESVTSFSTSFTSRFGTAPSRVAPRGTGRPVGWPDWSLRCGAFDKQQTASG